MSKVAELNLGNTGPIARAGERGRGRVRLSFEFFPPKTEAMEENLWAAIGRLAPLSPDFVSVTYGAGGSTRERTHRTVRRILAETNLKPAAHLTCVGASKAEVDEVIREYWDAGVRHIVALRGDPPEGIGGSYVPRADGYANATELTAAIKRIAPFEVIVGVYPEKHPESPSFEHDIRDDVGIGGAGEGQAWLGVELADDLDPLLDALDLGAALLSDHRQAVLEHVIEMLAHQQQFEAVVAGLAHQLQG